MAKKFVRGITDVKDITKQDFDTNNVNDFLSDGEHNYIHRKKKDNTEEYHNLTNNLKTLSSSDTDLLTVTNNNNSNNTAVLHPQHDAKKEQVIESTRGTITINHGDNGTTNKTTVDTNQQIVLEHDNLLAGANITKEHTDGSNTTTLKVADEFVKRVTDLENRKCLTMHGNITSVKPPYDDLDTLPENSEVTYSTLSGVKHLPSIGLGGCDVLTFSTQENNKLGTIQYLITPEGEQYFRTHWYYSETKKWDEWHRFKVENEYEYGLELFKNIAVVGDSYSSGELYVNDDYVDYYDISWIQLLARRHGLQATNYSKGGLTAKTWLTDAKGKTKMDADTAKDLYFVYLGINDKLKMTSYTDGVGTKDDIGTEKDSFYAKYSSIITNIKTKAPNAKIAIINMHDSTSTVFAPINEIAKHFSLPVLTLANDYSLSKTSYTSEMNQGHPQALGYARLAGAIERLMSESFVKNKSYWMSYVPAINE